VDVRRVDGPDKVTGRARYAADIVRPGRLWGKVLRSPLAHARIGSIDTSRAQALAGVHAVLTGADLPDVRVGRQMRDLPVLARDRVRFVGEKVAAVAADDPSVAEEACRRIDIEYVELPAVFDPIGAMDNGAPELHAPADIEARLPATATPAHVHNGVSHSVWGHTPAEVEAALAAADHVFEQTFHVPLQHQGYLEPHACIVEAHADGRVEVWASQKAPFLLRDYFRLGLGIAAKDLQIHLLPVGGDFGGKGSIMDCGVAYFLSRATGRPVKIVMTYAEELTAGNPRHFGTIVVRTGVGQDGTLLARHVRQVYASGAYAGMKPYADVNLPAARGAAGAYRIPRACVESLMIATNTVHSGHMRSPGGIQAAFVSEVQLDHIARQLGLDPLELRLRHAPRAGDPDPSGGVFHQSRAREVLEAAAQTIDWHAPRPRWVGKGIALQEHGVTRLPYSAEVGVHPDGRVVLRTPIPEVGVGSHTVFRQLLARELSVPVESIEVVASMDGLPYDRGSGGSRVTRLSGGAIREAAARVRERLLAGVAAEFQVDTATLSLADGCVSVSDRLRVSLGEAAQLAGGAVVEQHQYLNEEPATVHAWSAQAAEVEVDPDTGQVRVLRMVSAHDVGEVVNPLLHQGQIEGAIVQGYGAALMERLTLDEAGRPIEPHLGSYKLPSMTDLPPLQVVLLPPDTAAGIKPIGEGANCGIVAAIANAIAQVTGVCPSRYPILAEDVLAALPLTSSAST
jgi:CO/xanthine dehydrogenase Mo-binding subunit